jgi:biopolymer transport protein TolR
MGLSSNDAFAAGGPSRRRRRGRSRRGALSEINVTPLVDVMLVLLIVFMISAPLLTVGVPVELPKTEAGAMQDQSQPLTVSIRADGSIFVQEDQVAFSGLAPRLHAMAGEGAQKPIYVRADGKASYAVVAQVMAALSTSGFSAINLITDTGGPSSGPRSADHSPPAPQTAGTAPTP